METPRLRAAGMADASDQSRPTESQTKTVGVVAKTLAMLRVNNADDRARTRIHSCEDVQSKPRSERNARNRHIPQSACASSMHSNNLMSWLQTDCPPELLPRVLVFAGPQTTAALSMTCRFWKQIIDQESTWKTLCEELYKVSQLHAPVYA